MQNATSGVTGTGLDMRRLDKHKLVLLATIELIALKASTNRPDEIRRVMAIYQTAYSHGAHDGVAYGVKSYEDGGRIKSLPETVKDHEG